MKDKGGLVLKRGNKYLGIDWDVNDRTVIIVVEMIDGVMHIVDMFDFDHKRPSKEEMESRIKKLGEKYGEKHSANLLLQKENKK